jgi:hypothetical protein
MAIITTSEVDRALTFSKREMVRCCVRASPAVFLAGQPVK